MHKICEAPIFCLSYRHRMDIVSQVVPLVRAALLQTYVPYWLLLYWNIPWKLGIVCRQYSQMEVELFVTRSMLHGSVHS